MAQLFSLGHKRAFMPKRGIKIIAETVGTGQELKKGDRVRLRYDWEIRKNGRSVNHPQDGFSA